VLGSVGSRVVGAFNGLAVLGASVGTSLEG
jgi:hypothetical protein